MKSLEPKKSDFKGIFVIWIFLFGGLIFWIYFGYAFVHKLTLTDPIAAVEVGKLYLNQGKIELAASKFQEAISMNATNREPYLYLGKIYLLQGNYQAGFTSLIQYQRLKIDRYPESIRDEVEQKCLAIGEQAVQTNDWSLADRAFNTAAIISDDPVDVLYRLYSQYSTPQFLMVRKNLWSDTEISLTLEDFENAIEPILWHGLAHPKAVIRNHKITSEKVHRGKSAEYLEITYPMEGQDFWIKRLFIPVTRPFGIRVFVTSDIESVIRLHWDMSYLPKDITKPAPRAGHHSPETVIRPGVWTKLEFPDMYQLALEGAKMDNNRSTTDMNFREIVINTMGKNCKLYVDDIQIFLPW